MLGVLFSLPECTIYPHGFGFHMLSTPRQISASFKGHTNPCCCVECLGFLLTEPCHFGFGTLVPNKGFDAVFRNIQNLHKDLAYIYFCDQSILLYFILGGWGDSLVSRETLVHPWSSLASQSSKSVNSSFTERPCLRRQVTSDQGRYPGLTQGLHMNAHVFM